MKKKGDGMDIFFSSANAVLPVFMLVLLGYILKIAGVISKAYAEQTNRLCFRLFLPASIFNNIYKSGDQMGTYKDLILFTAVISVVMIAVLSLTVPALVKDNRRRGVVIQGLYRSNSLILGVPLSANLFGPEGVLPTVILIATVIPLFNVSAAVLLTVFQEMGTSLNDCIRRVVFSLLKNPLILAAATGMICVRLQPALPDIVMNSIEDLSDIAGPLALVSLGAVFEMKRIRDNLKQIITVSVLKMLVIPGILSTVAVLWGFRGPELGAVLAIFATPTAVSSYVMASESRGDGELAGQFVVFTTLIACLTLFLFVYIFKGLHLL